MYSYNEHDQFIDNKQMKPLSNDSTQDNSNIVRHCYFNIFTRQLI